MKKIVALVSAWACILALAGCGADGRRPGENGNSDGYRGVGQAGDSAGLAVSSGVDDGCLGQNAGSAGLMEEGSGADGNGSGQDGASADGRDGEVAILKLRIVDGADSGSLMLAGESGGSVYSLSVKNGAIPIYLDGEPADSSALEDGMMIEVSFNGNVMETFPGQLGQVYGIYSYSRGTKQNPGGGYYDLCGLYLQVLEDLWDRDAGLNGGISYISVDMSDAPGGLTDGEKEAVAWIFGSRHGAEPLAMSYEDLAEQGYLTEVESAGDFKMYQWEDGILFTITSSQGEAGGTYSLPTLKFNAEKWRGPLGAYFLLDCFAVWPEMGTWDGYEIGGEAIS